MEKNKLLEVKGLSVSFDRYDKLSNSLHKVKLEVINDLDITVREGEILAIAGSSGSGKSLLASAIMGILPQNASINRGEIRYCQEKMTEERLQQCRGRQIALIPQSVNYLDPLQQVGKQVIGVRGTLQRQKEIFSQYDLNDNVEKMYPYQLSGGMARRVLIATALMEDAKVIIADEPTPGLSVELARETMEIFRKLADEGRGIILITHDIDLAFTYADRVTIFYAGITVENALAQDFRKGPQALRHPYTKALWNALPQNGFKPIPGTQPYPGQIKTGCRFAPRCPYKDENCEKTIPIKELRGGEVRCIHAT